MVDILQNYVDFVLKNKKKLSIGANELKSIERHEKLKKNNKYYFDVEESNRIIKITEQLNISKGEQGQKFKLRGFQAFILGSIVGWKVKETNKVLFKEGYIQIGRQNGKSLLVTALINYRATFGEYKNGRIICAATKKEQAKIVWDNLKNFILADNDLKQFYKIQEHISTITSLITNNKIIAIGRNTTSVEGFDSILSICDELHLHPNNQTYKILYNGQVNVPNGQTIAITTAGIDLNSYAFNMYELCCNILDGLYDKDSHFVYITDTDKGDDLKNKLTWVKANPFLLYDENYKINNEKLKIFSDDFNTALRIGDADLVDFKTKRLNMWVASQENKYLDNEMVKNALVEYNEDDFYNKDVIIGVDLSSGGDLTSVSILIIDDETEKVKILSHSFIPANVLLKKEQKSQAPFREWKNRNLLTTTETAGGFKTDYKAILIYIKDLVKKYNFEIKAIGYDPYGAGAWLNDLEEYFNTEIVAITQSAKNLGSTVEDFKLSIDSKEIQIDKLNPLYLWSLANATVVHNSFGEPKIEKKRQGDKIDPLMASINAWYLYLNNKEKIKNHQNLIDWINWGE